MIDRVNKKLKDNVHLSSWFSIPISVVAIALSFNANSNSNDALNKSEKAYQSSIKNKYFEDMDMLTIKIFTMDNISSMKKELYSYVEKYPKKVLPYIKLYDYYIKIGDKNAALDTLKDSLQKTKPIDTKEYLTLVKILKENNIKNDLQKRYIKQAYLKRMSVYSDKKEIEELYDELILHKKRSHIPKTPNKTE